MKAWRADGCDFFSTFEAMRALLDHVRGGGGPAAIELDTERFYGHFEGDPQRYRGPGELDRIRAQRDCLKIFRERVGDYGQIAPADLEAIDAEVARLIDEAVAEAKAAPPPAPEQLLEDVYVSY